jgi:hypothetical protein
MSTKHLYHRVRTSLLEGLAPCSEPEFQRRCRILHYLTRRMGRLTS